MQLFAMKTPEFWQKAGPMAALLRPAAALYGFLYRIRCAINLDPYKSRIPVICVGNITVGGSGKTPIAIEISKILKESGKTFCFFSKGYGGKFRGAIKFNGENANAGDEALLLLEHGDVFASKNRVEGLKFINENFNYDYIIMDDGLQNPTIVKDRKILAVDGIYGFGNEQTLPAGPLREIFRDARQKIDLTIVGEPDEHNVGVICKKYNMLCIKSKIVPEMKEEYLTKEYVAFCGIGNPNKFKRTLQENKINVAEFVEFGDHCRYSASDIKKLKSYGKSLITTRKDWVKLNDNLKKETDCLDIRLEFSDDETLKRILLDLPRT